MRRRPLLAAAVLMPRLLRASQCETSLPVVLPRDFGAHLDSRVEWWYAAGQLRPEGAAQHPVGAIYGFQITFFRVRTGLGRDNPGRFSPRQLLFAHAALTNLSDRTHRLAQRVTRWNEDPASELAGADTRDTDVRLRTWRLRRESSGDTSRYRVRIDEPSREIDIDLLFTTTQPMLLHSDSGWLRKGPDPMSGSHYYSEPQLRVQGEVSISGQRIGVAGNGWLDHEWANSLMSPEAVGWDWIGMNLNDGGALMATQWRRADGSPVWAHASLRTRSGEVRRYGPAEVRFKPGRRWSSPTTRAAYPVEWLIETPAGGYQVRSRLDPQEVDARSSTGNVYYEGLSDLLDPKGERLGSGYLEMTGYAGRLTL